MWCFILLHSWYWSSKTSDWSKIHRTKNFLQASIIILQGDGSQIKISWGELSQSTVSSLKLATSPSLESNSEMVFDTFTFRNLSLLIEVHQNWCPFRIINQSHFHFLNSFKLRWLRFKQKGLKSENEKCENVKSFQWKVNYFQLNLDL